MKLGLWQKLDLLKRSWRFWSSLIPSEKLPYFVAENKRFPSSEDYLAISFLCVDLELGIWPKLLT